GGDGHRPGDGEGAEWLGDAGGGEDAAPPLGAAREDRHLPSRGQAEVLEALGRPLDAVPPERPEQLLGTMDGQIATQHEPGDTGDVAHGAMLRTVGLLGVMRPAFWTEYA